MLDGQGVQLTQAQVTEQPRDPRQGLNSGAGNADANAGHQRSDGERAGRGSGNDGGLDDDEAAGRTVFDTGRGIVDYYV